MSPVQTFALGVYVGFMLKIALDHLDEIEARITRVEFEGIARRFTTSSSIDSPTPKQAEG